MNNLLLLKGLSGKDNNNMIKTRIVTYIYIYITVLKLHWVVCFNKLICESNKISDKVDKKDYCISIIIKLLANKNNEFITK